MLALNKQRKNLQERIGHSSLLLQAQDTTDTTSIGQGVIDSHLQVLVLDGTKTQERGWQWYSEIFNRSEKSDE